MTLNRITCLCSLSAALVYLGIATVPVAAQAQDEIRFMSWTGPYMRSQMLGFVRPYEQASGVKVHVDHYDGGIDGIRDEVESANVVTDVIDLTQADSLRACKEGLLEDISDIDLPNGTDGTPFREDFVDGALTECGVGVVVWATAFAYEHDAFGGKKPTSINDFFDTKNFPGRRAIRNDPTVVMEWALLVDGVPQGDVYSVLETPEGIERALKVMDRIKPGLRLWATGSEAARLLNANEVVMSSMWATTGVVLSKKPNANFSIVWDGKVIELDLFGIPKGSLNVEAAKKFIRFASNSNSLANMVEYLPNGPTRKSSLKLVSESVLAQLPNNPANADKVTITSDAEWWSKNHVMLEEAFDEWIAKSGQKGASGTVR